MGKMDVDILSIASTEIASILEVALQHNGFYRFQDPQEYVKLLHSAEYRKRGDLEVDPTYKQIIPYLVLSNRETYLCYTRPTINDEVRLKDKKSLGIGGHVEITDKTDTIEIITNALVREATEEFQAVLSIGTLAPLGIIYTNATEVDSLHIGILFTCEVEQTEFNIDPLEVSQYEFMTKNKLQELLTASGDSMENWSKIASNVLILNN